MPTPYRYLRCGDPRSPGVMERRNGHSDYATTMMVLVLRLLVSYYDNDDHNYNYDYVPS